MNASSSIESYIALSKKPLFEPLKAATNLLVFWSLFDTYMLAEMSSTYLSISLRI